MRRYALIPRFFVPILFPLLGLQGANRGLKGYTRLEFVGVFRQITVLIEGIHALSRRRQGFESP